MPLELVVVPCLADNFAFLLHDAGSGATALVDAPEAAPVQAALAARGWRLGLILLTHHHDDHVQAVPDLRAGGVPVWGAAADAHRLPPLDRALHPGDPVQVGDEAGVVIDVPGHTVGHIAFHFPASALAFTGDSLMAAGCGRLFEGTADQMWDSLSRLASLPGATRICSGHDYLAGNLHFAQSVDPGNPALAARAEAVATLRREGRLPMPWTLAEERATNPFLRAPDTAMKAALGLAGAPDAKVFAELRRRKDRF